MFIRPTRTVLIPDTKKWAPSIKIAFWVWLILSGNLWALDLGVLGSVYEIKEMNALNFIEQKLQLLDAKGEVLRQQEYLKTEVLKASENPKGYRLPRAIKNHSFEKDLKITLSQDIKDPHGNIIHKTGSIINPLALKPTNLSLILFDAMDTQQLNWALKEFEKRKHTTKLVLSNGPVLKLMRALDKPLYFDQNGSLARYFNIKFLPAIIEQVNDKLMVSEVKL